MPTYFCQLGSFPQLAQAEIQALTQQKASLVSKRFAQIELKDDVSAQSLLNSLGGTVKIHRVLFQLNDATDIGQKLIEILHEQTKPLFALSYYPQSLAETVTPEEIKRQLKAEGVSSRYIVSQSGGLPAASFFHGQVQEFSLIKDEAKFQVCQTVAVQPIKDWIKRDRSKPYADRKRGMLAPKLARMMLNLALGQIQHSPQSETTPIIYDPFCGTGTVLIEATLSGLPVVGSDIAPAATAGTKDNLAWLNQEFELGKLESFIFTHDATQSYSESERQRLKTLFSQPVLVVSEPFLGKPHPQTKQLKNIFKGLEKLYLGFFKNLRTILPTESYLVMVFPFYQSRERYALYELLIDKLEVLGYTTCLGPFEYFRPDAVIKRQIVGLKFKKS